MTNAWFSGTPKTPGPYWTWAAEDEPLGGGPQRVWVSQDCVTDTDGDNTPRHMLRSSRLWHAWQTASPEPPDPAALFQDDPGPGVWTDRPFMGGLHRILTPKDGPAEDVWVRAHSAQPWTHWGINFVDGRTSMSFSAGGEQPTRWYRYPEPPHDSK